MPSKCEIIPRKSGGNLQVPPFSPYSRTESQAVPISKRSSSRYPDLSVCSGSPSSAVSQQQQKLVLGSVIQAQLIALIRSPQPELMVTVDPVADNTIHCIIVGPEDSPFAGGFFYFIITYKTSRVSQSGDLVPEILLHTPAGKSEVRGGRRFDFAFWSADEYEAEFLFNSGPAARPEVELCDILHHLRKVMSSAPYLHRASQQGSEAMWWDLWRANTLNDAILGFLEKSHRSLGMPAALYNRALEYFMEHWRSQYQVRAMSGGPDTETRMRQLYKKFGPFYYDPANQASVILTPSILPSPPFGSPGNPVFRVPPFYSHSSPLASSPLSVSSYGFPTPPLHTPRKQVPSTCEYEPHHAHDLANQVANLVVGGGESKSRRHSKKNRGCGEPTPAAVCSRIIF